jgi:hypothetical protein
VVRVRPDAFVCSPPTPPSLFSSLLWAIAAMGRHLFAVFILFELAALYN